MSTAVGHTPSWVEQMSAAIEHTLVRVAHASLTDRSWMRRLWGIGSFVSYFKKEVELIEAPIPNLNMDDYVMIELELAHDETRWKDYRLPCSPVSICLDSTLLGVGTEFYLVLLSNDDGDQIVLSTSVMSPIVPSFTYPNLPDSPLTSLWRDYDCMRRGDAIETEMGVLATLALVLWEPYCNTCGELGHCPRMCRFYRPYGDLVIWFRLCDGTGNYASVCLIVIAGPPEGSSRMFPSTMTDASTSESMEDYWTSSRCPCIMCRNIYS
ncbi:hypothetical protein AXX17_AT4G10080 [Arabidopsis thaliana]|uniref:CCHC-type domain-containing protein n=1 Tax=Arabidopsis thaliana TaxID=3702 RepID=A0A178UXR2_ARATH|nr:hypothetical protein AXX17_AT4G10080 [Arabidopsis thaliana]